MACPRVASPPILPPHPLPGPPPSHPPFPTLLLLLSLPPPPSPPPRTQIVEQHKAFLRRLMKGCLLSRKVVVLRALLGLKDLALRFVRASDEHAALSWEALEEEAEQRMMGAAPAALCLGWGCGDAGRRWRAVCRCVGRCR